MPLNVDLLRKDNGDGTSKDWAAAVVTEPISANAGNRAAVVVWFGPTGGTLQYRRIPPARWRTSSADEEVRKRYAEKQAKGYVLAGAGDVEDDLSLKVLAPGHPADPSAVPVPRKVVYYEVFISRSTQRTREQIAGDYLATIRRLAGEIAGASIDGAVLAVRIGTWSMHIGTQGVRCAGQIDPRHGLEPLLFLMALKRSAPPGVEVNLARDDQVEVSHQALAEEEVLSWFDTTPDEIAPLAARLGLVVSIVDKTQAANQPDFYF